LEREIPSGLVEKTRTWLGKKGIDFFKEMKEKHGEYAAVFMEGRLPHAVHFREGMQVRNFMRKNGCENWDAHDLDDSWVSLITEVVENGR